MCKLCKWEQYADLAKCGLDHKIPYGTELLTSVTKQARERKHITEKQARAVYNIVTKWHGKPLEVKELLRNDAFITWAKDLVKERKSSHKIVKTDKMEKEDNEENLNAFEMFI